MVDRRCDIYVMSATFLHCQPRARLSRAGGRDGTAKHQGLTSHVTDQALRTHVTDDPRDRPGNQTCTLRSRKCTARLTEMDP